MSFSEVKRIAVIGNSGGGKSALSRRLAKSYNLPVTHIDSIQFLPGMVIRPLDETRAQLNQITSKDEWIIDGYGPLDLLEGRLTRATHILFIDFPIWRHYWWCTKRQIKNILIKRPELPDGCNELTIQHTIKLFRTLWRVHKKMRPEMLKILNRPAYSSKTRMIRSLSNWQRIADHGI